MGYKSDAVSDAQDMAREFLDQIVESFMDNDGEASDDLLNDYGGDAYHHETHVDKEYDLSEAAACLDELDDYEETDSGLWEGLEPRKAIGAQAAYTYGNAVMSLWRDIVKEVNGDDVLTGLMVDYEAIEQEVEDELEEALEKARDEYVPDDDDDEFDEASYDPPFEQDDEVEKRQGVVKGKIEARIREVIDEFGG